MASAFCPLCEVSLDLHDGPDSCDLAGRRAGVVALGFMMGLGPREMFPMAGETR